MNGGERSRPRVLVAGVGNIFLGDDAFGVEVAQRLARRPQPEGVRIADFGIRGLDLAYALLDNYEAVVLMDAAPRGGLPGTLYVLEPDPGPGVSSSEGAPLIEMHNLDPARVLRLVAALGGQVRRLLVVGCEPERWGVEDVSAEMSAPVRKAVDEAVPFVEALVARLLRGEDPAGLRPAAACAEDSIPGEEVRTCRTRDRTA
jgi:hydrogenase maturation protease